MSAYGQDALNFDINDPFESMLRAPVAWRHQIRTPTYVFEGTKGNYRSLLLLEAGNQNRKLKCFEVEDLDHFAVIQPLVQLIADKIKAQDVSIDDDDIEQAFPHVALKRQESERAYDTKIRQLLVGRWHEDFEGHGYAIATFYSNGKYNGEFIADAKGGLDNSTYSGTWSVEDSILSYRLTEASDPVFLEHYAVCNDKILDINEAFLAYKSNDMPTGLKQMSRIVEPIAE